MTMQTPIRRASLRLPVLVGWEKHLAALGVLAGAILLIFHRDAIDMASIWWNASTFGHCLIIPFILIWLVQQRAAQLRALTPAAWWPGLLLVGAGSFGWMLGEAAGVALFRHAGLVLMLQGAVIMVVGPVISRALAFPIFYALFLIPFGEELVPTLQIITAHLSMFILDAVNLPAHMEGVFITTPTGYFEVAEACSGAKFLIAMTAYGALVCNVCFKRWDRRAIFLLFALGTSVLANGVRAAGTIIIAHLTSIDFAKSFDHVVYGWVFFGLVIAGIMAIAWRFFDRGPGDVFIDVEALKARARPGRPLLPIAAAALGVAALSPIWSHAIASSADPVNSAYELPVKFNGWQRISGEGGVAWSPHFAGADRIVQGRYRDGAGRTVDVAIAAFDRQEEGRELVGFGQGAVGPESRWAWAQPAVAPAGGHGEIIAGPGPTYRHVVTFYVIDGAVVGRATEVKLRTLKLRLLGGDQRAAAVMVSTEQAPGKDSAAVLKQFLSALGSVKSLADQATGIR